MPLQTVHLTAIEVCKYCNCVQDILREKLLQRHAKDKRRPVRRSSSKQDTASPTGGHRSTRNQVSAKEKNDTEQSWSPRIIRLTQLTYMTVA